MISVTIQADSQTNDSVVIMASMEKQNKIFISFALEVRNLCHKCKFQ